jgi:hypothetical protein
MDRDAEKDDHLAAEPVVDQRDLEGERDPGLAAEPVVDQGSYGTGAQEPDGQDGVYDQEADQASRQPPPNS